MPLQRFISCDFCTATEGPYTASTGGSDKGPAGWIMLTVERSDKGGSEEIANLAATLSDAAWDAPMRMNALPVQVTGACCPACWSSRVLQAAVKPIVDNLIAKARDEEMQARGYVTPLRRPVSPDPDTSVPPPWYIEPARPSDVWSREEDDGDVPSGDLFDGCR